MPNLTTCLTELSLPAIGSIGNAENNGVVGGEPFLLNCEVLLVRNEKLWGGGGEGTIALLKSEKQKLIV